MGKDEAMNDVSRYRDRGEPPNVTSIEQRLLWLARDQGVPINRLRHRFAVIVLADLMSTITVDGNDPVFLVKGGTAMLLRFGITRSRLSKDLDAAVASALDPFVEELRARGREPFHGFTAQVTKDAPIALPGGGIPPRRLSVKMTYKGRSFATIKVELSVAEGASASEYDIATADDLAALGFESDDTDQRLLSLRYQIAQKLHACTERRDDRPNDRAHDLVDLVLLELAVADELGPVRAACEEIFDLRGAHRWPPMLVPEPHWEPIYARAADQLTHVVPATLTDAVGQVNRFIARIDGS